MKVLFDSRDYLEDSESEYTYDDFLDMVNPNIDTDVDQFVVVGRGANWQGKIGYIAREFDTLLKCISFCCRNGDDVKIYKHYNNLYVFE